MKTTNLLKEKTSNYFWVYALPLLLVSLLFNACSKLETTPDNMSTRLTINVDGISNIDNLVETKASTNNSSVISNTLRKTESFKSNNFVVDIISEQNTVGAELEKKSALNLTNASDVLGRSLQKAATKTPMESGVKYAFLLFDKTTNVLKHSILASSGQPIVIDVVKGYNFKWVAYSFNTSDTFDLPNQDSLVIPTPVDKALLYASGEIDPQLGNNPVSITFDHKLTQLNVSLDSRRMFFDFSQISATFKSDCIKSTSFDLFTGQKTGELKSVDRGKLIFESEETGSKRMLISRSNFTAAESITEYTVAFQSISGTYPNGNAETISNTLPGQGDVTFSGFTGTTIGNILHGKIKLWLILPEKKIFSYGSFGWGYAAESGRASGSFLRSSYNFGEQSNYLRVKGLQFSEEQSGGGKLATIFADPANYPDVLISGVFSGSSIGYNADDYAALLKYLKSGGVAFLMTEHMTSDLQNFFAELFNINASNIKLDLHDMGGSVYKIADVDTDVLNGVFGDARGKYWGQDASSTQYTTGFNENEVVVYSRGASNFENPPIGATMFRHKTLNLFFVGDTGFLANFMTSGTLDAIYCCSGPFSTKGGSGPDMDIPVPNPTYGHFTRPNSLDYPNPNVNAQYTIYNSIVFGNAFTWLLERSHFMGINREG